MRREIWLWSVDACGLASSAFLAYYLRSLFEIPGHTLYPFSIYTSFFFVLIASFMISLLIHGFYNRMDHRDRRKFLVALFKVNYSFLLTVVAASFALHLTNTNRVVFFLFTASSNLLVVVTRLAFSHAPTRRFAILGKDARALEAYQEAIQTLSLAAGSFVGFYAVDWEGQYYFQQKQVHHSGSIDTLWEAIRAKQIDTLILALPDDFSDAQRVVQDFQVRDLDVIIARKLPAQLIFSAID